MNANKILLLLVILMACVTPALAVGKFYENKIVPYDGVAEFNALPQNLYGTLQVHLRSSDNFLTPEIGIRNQIEPNGTFRFFPILPDGTFEMQLIPGRYDLFLQDGNGGQPEHSTALVVAGMTSYPERELLGHAYAGSPEVTEPVVITDIHICSALYYPDRNKDPIDGHVKLTWENHFGIAGVTGSVRALVNGGQTTFVVSNDNLGGDPAYGWYKKLTVVYVVGEGSCRHPCDWKSQTADEGSSITLS